ncbi:hypothetical protein A3709_02520 [Halioglobus sp. HI00S01]|nr:hypothetical protein A3709_02520 [Halioglobus sp. HI00S01]
MGVPRVAGCGVVFPPNKIIQNSIDDVLVFDTRDDSGRSATADPDFDIYVEYSFESLGPGHGIGVLVGDELQSSAGTVL